MSPKEKALELVIKFQEEISIIMGIKCALITVDEILLHEKNNHFNIGWFSIWKCNDMFLCDKNGVVVKTVHQLQNLYFSIYQTELKMIK